jgi:Secretion system C-terminal sorting domain
MDSRNVRLQIFPNPVKSILNVQVSGYNENALLQIIDITGRKVKEEKISLNGTTSVSVDVNNLSKGTYDLLLKGKSINEQKKFVKE